MVAEHAARQKVSCVIKTCVINNGLLLLLQNKRKKVAEVQASKTAKKLKEFKFQTLIIFPQSHYRVNFLWVCHRRSLWVYDFMEGNWSQITQTVLDVCGQDDDRTILPCSFNYPFIVALVVIASILKVKFSHHYKSKRQVKLI